MIYKLFIYDINFFCCAFLLLIKYFNIFYIDYPDLGKKKIENNVPVLLNNNCLVGQPINDDAGM